MRSTSSHAMVSLVRIVSNFFNYFSSAIPTSDIDFVADKNINFDFLIFAQQWPLTHCILLTEKSKHHICDVSIFRNQYWTIHGIWPTRIGSKSPAYCNKSVQFDFHQLEPCIEELNKYWINVANDRSTTLFWKNEWVKHGSCCVEQIQELATEQKYFVQGIKWSQDFQMSAILESAAVTPGGQYKVVDIHNLVYEKLKKIPSIHCIQTNDGHNYLSEIRICFSKSLEMIDCHVTGNAEVVYKSPYSNMEIITNCNLHKDVVYPITFPENDFGPKSNNWKSWLGNKLYDVLDSLKQSLL